MKKTLIALAVLGAFGAAQAADVTIYGQLQPSYDFIDTGAADNTADMKWNNSRIGFKGSEDLGSGMKAIFQIESKVSLTEKGTDQDGLGDRDSWVGLAGSFGSITFGNHQTAYVKSSASYDFFADSIGDYNNIMGADGAGDDTFNKRVAKSAYYKSPVMSGFQVLASYAMKAAHDGTADQDYVSIAGTYVNGPLQVVAAYEVQKAGAAEDLEGLKIGAGYKLPFGTQVNAIYEKVDQDLVLDSVNHFYLGVSHPVTASIDVMGNYMYAGDNDIVGNDSGAKGYAIGAKYKFSKRTNVMAVYAAVDNDTNGAYAMDSGYSAAAGQDKVSGFSVRLQHKF